MTLEEKFLKVEGSLVAIMHSGDGFAVGEPVGGLHFHYIGQPQSTIEEAIDDALKRQKAEKAEKGKKK